MNRFHNIYIILVEPQGPRNIGSTCRAMKAMGFENLILVNPKSVNLQEIKTMACTTEDIFHKAPIYETLDEAVQNLDWIIGTTGRKRHEYTYLLPIDKAAQEIAARTESQKIGILFGREDWGLSNEQLDHCQALATIDTAQFHSINLSQSVMITCYEIRRYLAQPAESKLEWAEQKDMNSLLDGWADLLSNTGYINRGDPDSLIRSFKQIFMRAGLTKRETRIFKGIESHFKKIYEKSKKN